MDVLDVNFHVLYIVLIVILEIVSNVMRLMVGIYKVITHVQHIVVMLSKYSKKKIVMMLIQNNWMVAINVYILVINIVWNVLKELV